MQKELQRYEDIHSAIIPCLFHAQKENKGFISPAVISHLSELMKIPESRINEVFHFYTMFNKEKVGRYHIQVCCNLSCAMNGSRELVRALCTEFGSKENEVSPDGRYTISRVECLGSCDTAPMMQVNDDYVENLDFEKALQHLRELP